MSGTFVHAIGFRRIEFIGNDGLPHYELEPVDGASEGMGNTTWRELKHFFAGLGVPAEAWPEFPDHQCSIDIPLPQVNARNIALRRAIHENRQAIDRAVLPELCRKILSYIDRGESLFFTPV